VFPETTGVKLEPTLRSHKRSPACFRLDRNCTAENASSVKPFIRDNRRARYVCQPDTARLRPDPYHSVTPFGDQPLQRQKAIFSTRASKHNEVEPDIAGLDAAKMPAVSGMPDRSKAKSHPAATKQYFIAGCHHKTPVRPNRDWRHTCRFFQRIAPDFPDPEAGQSKPNKTSRNPVAAYTKAAPEAIPPPGARLFSSSGLRTHATSAHHPDRDEGCPHCLPDRRHRPALFHPRGPDEARTFRRPGRSATCCRPLRVATTAGQRNIARIVGVDSQMVVQLDQGSTQARWRQFWYQDEPIMDLKDGKGLTGRAPAELLILPRKRIVTLYAIRQEHRFTSTPGKGASNSSKALRI